MERSNESDGDHRLQRCNEKAFFRQSDGCSCLSGNPDGAGAGFPGIPLKIAFPQIRLTLLDSLQKRLKFLQEVSDKLELGEIQMLHGRAEDYAKQPEFREHFDLCVSRAVANLSTLSELCLPYVKENGKFIPYKAEKAEAEIEAAQKAVDLLGGEISDKIEFQLPGGDMGRTLVVIDKIKKTPKKYPRKAGLSELVNMRRRCFT